ncbi:MAG TPA: alpha/beta hydrolase [Burkholderiaceae bacterium]
MTEPRLRHVSCASTRGLHRIGYAEWGPPDAPVLLCVHGLTRNGRDFDVLAERLSDRYRVVCPDMIGRGRSDFAADVAQYDFAQYVSDCVTLIARLDVEELSWLGTSMGGLIGMVMASIPGNAIRRLVLNDVGPVVGAAGVARIASDMGDDPTFTDFEHGERVLRQRLSEFGPHSDEQFRFLSRHHVVQRQGRWTFHYDPRIGQAAREALEKPAMPLWLVYDAIRCPVGVLRGEHSDILSAETAQEMTRRGPRARIEEVPGIGHAPTLIAEDQIAAVERLLHD